MSALGWVATMRDGSELPFRIYFGDGGAQFDPGVAKAIARVDRVTKAWIPPDDTPSYVPTRETPLFQVRGSVQRPLLRGGTVTKLVLRACPSNG